MKKLNYQKGAQALYMQIFQLLKEDIINNNMQVGMDIPTEMQVAKNFNVSRITARAAVMELEKAGFVERARGKGTTIIAQEPIHESLAKINSFTNEMIAKGMEPGTIYASIEYVKADEHVAKIFNIAQDDQIICLKRVRSANGNPVVYFVTFFGVERNLPMHSEQYLGSLYEVLERVGIHKPIKTHEVVRAVAASHEVAQNLQIAPDSPVLFRERTSYDENNKLLEYTLSYYPGDRYAYTIDLN